MPVELTGIMFHTTVFRRLSAVRRLSVVRRHLHIRNDQIKISMNLQEVFNIIFHSFGDISKLKS